MARGQKQYIEEFRNTIKDGWCYLASLMNLYCRKIIGYAMSKTIGTQLTLQAVILLAPRNAFIIMHV